MMLISILLLPLKELPLAFICSRKSPFLKDHFTGIMTICTIDNLMCLSVALYDEFCLFGVLWVSCIWMSSLSKFAKLLAIIALNLFPAPFSWNSCNSPDWIISKVLLLKQTLEFVGVFGSSVALSNFYCSCIVFLISFSCLCVFKRIILSTLIDLFPLVV